MKKAAILGISLLGFLASAAQAGQPRPTLDGPTTFRAAPGGSDNNDCVTAPCRTLQTAYDRAAKIDAFGYAVTIAEDPCADCGPLNAAVPILGASSVAIIGDIANPANCLVSITDGTPFAFEGPMKVFLAGFKTETLTSSGTVRAPHIDVSRGAAIDLGEWDFGQSAADHVIATQASLNHTAPYTISGGAYHSHHHAIISSVIGAENIAVILRNAPFFGGYYVGNAASFTSYGGAAFSYPDGPATGKQFYVHFNGTLRLSGVTLPGSLAGSLEGGNVDDDTAAHNFEATGAITTRVGINWTRDGVQAHGATATIDNYDQLRINPAPLRNVVIQGLSPPP
jgi:hypothetical protein